MIREVRSKRRRRGAWLAMTALAAVIAGCAGKQGPPPPVVETGPPPSSWSALDDPDVMDRVIAVVNNDAITLSELQENVLFHRSENRAERMDEAELSKRLLDRLIEGRLQLQEADRERVVVEDTEVSEELQERMKKFNARTLEEFEGMVRRQGLSLDVVRKKLRDQLMISKVIRRKVSFRVSVTEGEIDRYLDENRAKLETGLTYHARHILIPPEGEPPLAAWDAARAKADGVHARLLGGADFAEVAREVSKDGTAPDGGDLGPLKQGELAEDIEGQILRLSPGGLSAPFRTELGYHIVKLEDRETLSGELLARARQQIRDILFREKYEARLEAWLAEIKRRAIIEVRI